MKTTLFFVPESFYAFKCNNSTHDTSSLLEMVFLSCVREEVYYNEEKYQRDSFHSCSLKIVQGYISISLTDGKFGSILSHSMTFFQNEHHAYMNDAWNSILDILKTDYGQHKPKFSKGVYDYLKSKKYLQRLLSEISRESKYKDNDILDKYYKEFFLAGDALF